MDQMFYLAARYAIAHSNLPFCLEQLPANSEGGEDVEKLVHRYKTMQTGKRPQSEADLTG